MKIVQIGTGGWGKNHTRILSELGVLVAVCDSNLERSKEYGEKYSINYYESLDKLLDSEEFDGAFVVSADGTIEAAARYIDASAESVSVAKGLGARHWAAAAITRRTKSVAVAVSETSGTVRIFQNGEVILRIEPFRRAMKWKDFEYEPPSGD